MPRKIRPSAPALGAQPVQLGAAQDVALGEEEGDGGPGVWAEDEGKSAAFGQPAETAVPQENDTVGPPQHSKGTIARVLNSARIYCPDWSKAPSIPAAHHTILSSSVVAYIQGFRLTSDT